MMEPTRGRNQLLGTHSPMHGNISGNSGVLVPGIPKRAHGMWPSVLPNAAVFGRQEPVPLSLKSKEAPGCFLHPNPAPPSSGHLWGAAVGFSKELPKDLAATEEHAALTQVPSLPVPLLLLPVQSL